MPTSSLEAADDWLGWELLDDDTAEDALLVLGAADDVLEDGAEEDALVDWGAELDFCGVSEPCPAGNTNATTSMATMAMTAIAAIAMIAVRFDTELAASCGAEAEAGCDAGWTGTPAGSVLVLGFGLVSVFGSGSSSS